MNSQRASLPGLLEACGQLVIDGSMSTALEQMGVNLSHKLWTAKALVECPEKVKQVHWNYFHAGADCGITCSYQATIPGLMKAGYTQAEAEHIITESVRLFSGGPGGVVAGRGQSCRPRLAPVPGRDRPLRRVSGGRLRIPGQLRRFR